MEQWDDNAKKQARGKGLLTDRNMILKLMTEARVGLVNTACIQASHGNIDDEDSNDEEEDQLSGKITLKEKRSAFMRDMEESWQSTRMDDLTEDLEKFLGVRRHNKAIVFSEFLSHLDVVEVGLRSMGIRVLRFDGTTTREERSRALERFQDRDNHHDRVILVTIKSGGVGVDMTAATRIYHISQPWNPAVILQANGRAIRPGQKESVKVIIYHARRSMDDKTWRVLEDKRNRALQVLDPPHEVESVMSDMGDWTKEQIQEFLM